VVSLSRIPYNPQLGVAIISRIACGTPKKERITVILWTYSSDTSCRIVGLSRKWLLTIALENHIMFARFKPTI
jgi:hypothetical protein